MIEFLREYSDLIILFFTIVVGISTVVYAILTKKLVDETRRMRKSQIDPEVSVSLVHNEISISFIDFKVENIGMGPAYDVTFKIIEDFQMERRNLSDVGFIKHGIKYLSPKQVMSFFIASFIDNPEELAKKEIKLSVSYKNAIDELFDRTYILSFAQYSSFTKLGTPPLHKIANNIEKMREDLHSIIDGFKRINVNIYNRKDRTIEEEERERQYQEYLSSKKENGK